MYINCRGLSELCPKDSPKLTFNSLHYATLYGAIYNRPFFIIKYTIHYLEFMLKLSLYILDSIENILRIYLDVYNFEKRLIQFKIRFMMISSYSDMILRYLAIK